MTTVIRPVMENSMGRRSRGRWSCDPEYDGIKALGDVQKGKVSKILSKMIDYQSREAEASRIGTEIKLKEMGEKASKHMVSIFSGLFPTAAWGEQYMHIDIAPDSFELKVYAPGVFNREPMYAEWAAEIFKDGEIKHVQKLQEKNRLLVDIRAHITNSFKKKLPNNKRRTTGFTDNLIFLWNGILFNQQSLNKLNRLEANRMLDNRDWWPVAPEPGYTPTVEWFEPFMLDLIVTHGEV